MKTIAHETITLMGYKINLFPDNRVQIFNKNKLDVDTFKPIAEKLAQYLVDELFIENKKIRLEII